MALSSPGLEITVTDDSAYLPTATGTVPLVLIATEENKTFNSVLATGTIKSSAAKLQAVTSQRELISSFGYPSFKQTAAGTPIHGHELNEYGLMTAYSALGVSNRSFILRADIDTAQILGSTSRPLQDPANGTYWFDTTESVYGLHQWNATTQLYTNKTPLLVTDSNTNIGGIDYPNAEVGQSGSYAIVMTNTENVLFYKRSPLAILSENTPLWTIVGTDQWRLSHPVVVGNTLQPTFTGGDTLIINTVTVNITSTSLNSLIGDINDAAIPGVYAVNVDNKLAFYITSASKSNGSVADNKMRILNSDQGTPVTTAGIIPGYFNGVAQQVSTYTDVPNWRSGDAVPHPSGSLWLKSSSISQGANIVFKQFIADTKTWVSKAAPLYASSAAAVAALDAGGGGGINVGTLFIQTQGELLAATNNTIGYSVNVRTTQGNVSITGAVIDTNATIVPGNTFSIGYSKLGDSNLTFATLSVPTISGNPPSGLVNAIQNAGITELTAVYVAATNSITITHNHGGIIALKDLTGTPLSTCGFSTSLTGIKFDTVSGYMYKDGFSPLSYTVSQNRPYTAPADGTLWYFNDPLAVDIMVNDYGGWKGYQNVSTDARGYNLTQTDSAGVILAASAPIKQSDGITSLVPGDLWIDTSDLENYPALYRRSAANKWVAIDTVDRFTQNGVVFADARWDISGTTDPIGDPKVLTTTMLSSNYVDLDCPDYRLYPRGTLLFNMRRSGFNIKKYVVNHFNENDYPDVTLPAVAGTWLTASGLTNAGNMNAGHHAQRAIVIKALKGAIDGSSQIREESFAFNLLVCPGYPELIPNMVALNNDRKNTAFVIGDTPMFLKSNIIDLTAWSENSNGNGLSTADPYLGVYYPSALTNDIQGNTIVMPPSHVMLRTMIRSDNVSYMWFAPAGMRRGLVDNATDIGIVDVVTGEFLRNGVNQGLRDALYSMRINPLTILPNVGLVVWGQKTRNPFASSMDRINVARLVNYVRTVLGHAGDAFLFEPNDAQTRKEFVAMISSVFTDLISKRGIYDFFIQCDESNNTPDRVARLEMYCDVAIEPMRDVEFIFIPIRLKNPGAIAAM